MYCIFPQGLYIIKVKVQVLTQLFNLRVGKGEGEWRYRCQQGVHNQNKLSKWKQYGKILYLKGRTALLCKMFYLVCYGFSLQNRNISVCWLNGKQLDHKNIK